ncbi:MAG: peptidylprolyl isomerase [Microscillaceae bacterium]|nr:peptidylprolyl isomerase [Microscillaceae bacterium]
MTYQSITFYTLLLLSVLVGCGTAENPKTEEKPESSTTSEEVKLSYKMPQLTPGNVSESLKAYGEANPETQVVIHTDMGDIKIKLYEETPYHRANFIYLTKKGFFNGTVFYRIIQKFMIQGGAGDFPQRDEVKKKLGTYRVPSEYKTDQYFHKRGALSAAKKPGETPEIGSTPYDFFIVQGEKWSTGQLQTLAQQEKMQLSPAQTQVYSTVGGVPSLDGKHTVFGEVTEGLDVVDKIAALKTRADGWPLDGLVKMTIEVIE